MVFQKSITKKIETTDTKRPDAPQVTIRNPLDKETFVNGIELVLEPEFSQKGKMIILVNDVSIFDENDSEGFFGYAKYPIPLNKMLKRSNDIKIFAWNGTDTNTIKMRFNVSISENPEPFQSQAVPLGRDVLNTVVSEGEIIFPLADYKDVEQTKLLSLEGNNSILLLISSSNALIPILNDKNSQWGVSTNMIDGNLSTFKDATAGISPAEIMVLGTKREMFFDFGEPLVREIGIKASFTYSLDLSDGITLQIRVFESDDDITYTTLHSEILVIPAGLSSGEFLLDSNFTPLPTSRYFSIAFRIIEAGSGAVTMSANIYEVYDFHRRTGSASISFELLESETGQWIEYISAADIGAISQGQAVQKQIGSTIEDNPATNKFNRFLPSSQTQLRTKMVVTGNIRTSVSIIKGR